MIRGLSSKAAVFPLRGCLAAVLLAVVCQWCGAEPLRVFVSIGPQVEAVQRIGGEQVIVEVLLPAGANPETFSPGPAAMAKLGRAQLFFCIGVPFETALVHKIKASFPQLEIVDGTAGMTYQRLEAAGHHHGGHGHDGHACEEHEEHHHEAAVHDGHHGHHHEPGGPDPHVWLSIPNMMVFAQQVHDELTARLPEQRTQLSARLAEYRGELSALDEEIARQLEPLKGREVIVFHPAFGYYLSHYGLRQKAVELEGKEVSGRHLGTLIREAREEGMRHIFVQPQFSTRTAEVIAHEIGGAVLPLDPLPSSYSEGMKALCRQLLTGLRP